MDGEIFDNVKYEKAKAIARFNRFRRIKNLVQVFEILVALILLSWSSKRIPAAVKFSGELLFGASVYLLNPHVVFLIGNAIIIALFLLCKQTTAGNSSSDGDLCGEYVHEARQNTVSASVEEASSLSPLSPPPPAEEKSAAEDGGCMEEEEKELQIVVAANAQCEALETAIEEAREQIRKFERSQSEKLRKEISTRPRKELRRSETENGRLVLSSGNRERRLVTTSFDRVDNLSNEEFKLAIDAFINKHQMFIKEQKKAELQHFKYGI